MVAQDAVNQGAAVVLTSVGTARELGIPEDRMVYLHGYADADDTYVSQRQDLSASVPMKAAYQHAFEMAGKSVEDMSLFDIYSCFPIAVLAACDALGIDWQDERDLTITGGLPFFGGPGNSYSLHAIAELHQQLRSDSGAFGFISANGGYLSKQSVGIYSRQPATNWAPRETNQAQQQAENHPTLDVVYPSTVRLVSRRIRLSTKSPFRLLAMQSVETSIPIGECLQKWKEVMNKPSNPCSLMNHSAAWLTSEQPTEAPSWFSPTPLLRHDVPFFRHWNTP